VSNSLTTSVLPISSAISCCVASATASPASAAISFMPSTLRRISSSTGSSSEVISSSVGSSSTSSVKLSLTSSSSEVSSSVSSTSSQVQPSPIK
jgi:hypothetical protein